MGVGVCGHPGASAQSTAELVYVLEEENVTTLYLQMKARNAWEVGAKYNFASRVIQLTVKMVIYTDFFGYRDQNTLKKKTVCKITFFKMLLLK